MPTEPAGRRRSKGTGSVYQRQSDGRWCAEVSLEDGPPPDYKRRRRVMTSRTQAGVIDQLEAFLDANPQYRKSIGGPTSGLGYAARKEMRAQANAHTVEQWEDLVTRVTVCPYCQVDLGYWNRAKDHMTPISRGGDDSIDNLTPCCRDCNYAKGSMTVGEFVTFRMLKSRAR